MQPSESSHRARDACLVFLLGLPLFLAGLGDREFIGFECRFGLFAKEMLRSGIAFFPTVYGQPYPDYPSLQTVLICLASLPIGRVTIFTAMLPTAVFASLTLVFAYLLGASRSRRVGIHAVLLTLATAGFFSTARSPSLDHFLTACTTFTFWAAWTLRRPGPRWGLVALGLTAGFAFRGPIGLVIPASVVLIHHALAREWKGLGLTALLSSALLLLGMGALLLAAYRQGGEGFLRRVIDMQAVGRLSEESAKPFHYYLLRSPAVYAVSFPLALLAAALNWRKLLFDRESEEARWLRSLLGWMLIVLIGLSVPAAKKARYVLPMVPAASLLAASIFAGEGQGRAGSLLRRLFPRACTLAPVLGLASVLAVPLVAGRLGYAFEFPRAKALALFAVEAAAAVLILRMAVDGIRRQASLIAVGVLAYATLQVFLVEPLELSLESSRAFVEEVEGIRGGARPLVFFKIGPDAEDIKYAVNLDRDVRPLFLKSPEEIASLREPACFVAEKREEEALRERFREAFRVLAEGKIGHRRYIAFSVEGSR